MKNVNRFRTDAGVAGVFLSSDGVDPASEQWGTMALVTAHDPGVTHRTHFAKLSWSNGLLDFWDDFSEDGRLSPREGESDSPIAALAAPLSLRPNETGSVTFLLTWHFPNRQSWTPDDGKARWVGGAGCCEVGAPTIGNYYTTQYADAWDVAVKTWAEIKTLENDTLAFVNAFLESDLPDVVKEASLFNASTLRTQTCFRTPDGRFFGWEGSHDHDGSCYGSCTHVWNYEQATSFLFGSLAATMRDVEFNFSTRDDGLMHFRTSLPLSVPSQLGYAAADGQMGCLMKLYREWQLSGDDEFLRAMWPKARKALSFAWVPGGWDADQDGVMEGCQHNTMDCEYFGPNPEVGVWYLGALRACGEIAAYLGEDAFATKCRKLAENGSRWIDANLFNGEYYQQEVRAVGAEIAPGLNWFTKATPGDPNPDLQIGTGCMADQLVGQAVASLCGLGALLNESHMHTALQSLMRYNFRENFDGHFNHMRSYALRDDAGMLVATYPHGDRPKNPFPYCNEVWTGLEYTAAVGMIYAGMTDEALTIIRAVRNRHDGMRRNPFDEAECGHHYARAMASWAAVPAMTGFHYSGVTRSFEIGAGMATSFWSTGYAWGTFHQTASEGGIDIQLTVYRGSMELKSITITGVGTVDYPDIITIGDGTCLWRRISVDKQIKAA